MKNTLLRSWKVPLVGAAVIGLAWVGTGIAGAASEPSAVKDAATPPPSRCTLNVDCGNLAITGSEIVASAPVGFAARPAPQSTPDTQVWRAFATETPWIGPSGDPVGQRISVIVTRHATEVTAPAPVEDGALNRAGQRISSVRVGSRAVRAATKDVPLRATQDWNRIIPAPVTTLQLALTPKITVSVIGEGVETSKLAEFASKVEVR